MQQQKKLLQAGNHWLSASERGRSNVFKLQQGGWISVKCSVGEDSEHGVRIPGESLAPPAWLQPQAGGAAPRDFLGHSCQCLVAVLPQFGKKGKVQDKDKFSAITLW